MWDRLLVDCNIATMEGGMITTNNTDLYEDFKSLRAHGWVRDRADKAEWAAKHPNQFLQRRPTSL